MVWENIEVCSRPILAACNALVVWENLEVYSGEVSAADMHRYFGRI